MKQISIIIASICLIFSCTSNERKSIQTDKFVIKPENITHSDYDERTGLTRVSLKEPDCWGYIDKDSNVVIPFIFKFLNPFDSEGMAVGQIGEKYGFINTSGDTVVPFIYDDMGVFSQGLAPAKKNGKYGYVNREGQVVIPFQYDKERYFYKTGLAEACMDGKWGFINKKGEEVVQIIYSDADCHKMEEKLIFLKKKDKWAIFDKNGNQLTEFIYNQIYGTVQDFDYLDEEFLFKGLLLVRKGNQYQYLNEDAEIVVDFGYYTEATPFTQYGYAIVKKGKYYGVITPDNNPIIPFEYSLIEHPKQRYQDFYDEFYIHKNGKVGLLNENAELIADVVYDSFERDFCKINDSSHVIFIAKKDKDYTIVRTSRHSISKVKFELIELFDGNEYAIAKKNGKYGLIDINSNIKIPFDYTLIYNFKNQYLIQKDNFYGLIDKKSLEVIFPLEYQSIEGCYYDKNKFIAKKNGYYGIITLDKEVVVPFEYDEISNWVEYGPDEHFVVKNGKYGLMSRDGKIVIPTIYEQIFIDNGSLIKVKNNGFYGTVNWKNEIVHPIEYDNILWEWPFISGHGIDTIFIEKSGKYFATDIKGNTIVELVPKELIDKKFGYLLRRE